MDLKIGWLNNNNIAESGFITSATNFAKMSNF